MNQKHKTWLIITFLLAVSLACSIFPLKSSPTTTPLPNTNSETDSVPTVEGYIDSTIYSTGIEITQIIEVPGVIDHDGKYALTLPKNWALGALHKDFASIVEKESQPNENVKAFFEYFLKRGCSLIGFGYVNNKNVFVASV